QRRLARFHEKITVAAARPDLDKFESVIEQYRAQFPEVPMEKIAAGLAAMAVGETQLFVTEDVAQNGFREPRSMRDEGRPAYGERRFESDRPQRPDRRDDRGSRDDRGPRDRQSAGPMETYRIEVGRNHGVKPGNIVGAIANEAGVNSSVIGRIELFDE